MTMITSNNGFFDKFGGKYVAEIIRRPLDDLEAAFNKYIHDPEFLEERLRCTLPRQ